MHSCLDFFQFLVSYELFKGYCHANAQDCGNVLQLEFFTVWKNIIDSPEIFKRNHLHDLYVVVFYEHSDDASYFFPNLNLK